MNQKKLIIIAIVAFILADIVVLVVWANIHGRKVEQKAMLKADERL